MKIILKTNWQIMHKPLIVCCIIPFVMSLAVLILCISAKQYDFPLFALKMNFLLILFFYFIFTSIRISFDGEKLTFYKFFLPVKYFSAGEIKSVEYSFRSKWMRINHKYVFPIRLFPEKDFAELLEILSVKHGIKISGFEKE